MITKRTWIRSGIVEELDKRQQAFLDLVLEKIKYYYRELYGTRDCYKYPLTLTRLSKLCNRSTTTVINAVRLLANSVIEGKTEPEISYDRINSLGNNFHRTYRILLRQNIRKSSYLHKISWIFYRGNDKLTNPHGVTFTLRSGWHFFHANWYLLSYYIGFIF